MSKAMNLEIESLYFNSVWELVDLPEGVKPIWYKWIRERGIQLERYRPSKLDL